MPSSGGQTCARSEEHTSELQSHDNLVCRLLLEKKNNFTRAVAAQPFPRAAQGPPFTAAALVVTTCGRGAAANTAQVGVLLPLLFFFFNDPATTEIYPLPLHDPLPI